MNRADRLTGCNSIGSCCLGYTKVSYFYLAFFGNNDILRLNIPVNDMVCMGSFHTLGYLNRYPYSFFKFQFAFSLNKFLKSYAFNKFHDYIMQAFIFSYIIYINYIRMRKSRRRLSLSSELHNKILVGAVFFFKNLYCYLSAKSVIHCVINISHSA